MDHMEVVLSRAAGFKGGGDFGVEGGEVFGGADGEAAKDFEERVDVGAGSVEGGMQRQRRHRRDRRIAGG